MKPKNNYQLGALKRVVDNKDKQVIELTAQVKFLTRSNKIMKEKIRLYEKSNRKMKRNFAYLNLRKKRNI
jgi:hypothetical protein